jgi:diguanylate cyclase (GGDEF)-like protein
MIHQTAEIVAVLSSPQIACTVSSQTLLADFADKYLDSPHAYLVVEDEQGRAVGVVGVDDIRHRLESPSIHERLQWRNMPVEAAMNGRIGSVLAAPGSHQADMSLSSRPCTAISQDGVLVALATNEDVLVSWRSIEQTIRQAQNDHVTGLPLRSAFDSHLRAECSRASREGHSVGVILIDVDRFKEINDQFGHAAGDAVLGAVGRNLRATFRSYDMVARYGGDEFAVLCCGCRPGEIDLTIQRLRKGMQRLQTNLSLPRPIPTLSIGACVAHDLDDIDCPEQIIQTADECLYFAKREGRNRSFTTELGVESDVTC